MAERRRCCRIRDIRFIFFATYDGHVWYTNTDILYFESYIEVY